MDARTRSAPLLGLALAAAALATAGACPEPVDRPHVRLDGPTTPAPTAASPTDYAIRFVVAATHSPGPALERLHALVRYLSGQLERPVELVLRRTYLETNELLLRGKADAGFICSGAYALDRGKSGLHAIAVPVVDGDTTYRAYIIARKDAGITRLEDLRGASFAFTDPLSNTGYRYALARLAELGENSDGFFGRTFFTYSHDNSVFAVRDGLAIGATVDNLILYEVLASHPGLEEELHVVERSEPYPINPVVVTDSTCPALRAALERAFLTMADTPDGREVLAAFGFSAFVPVDDARYAPMTESWRRVETTHPAQEAPR